jgi:peptidoglycan/LPS O-acetylase OafA/YrhL
MNQTSSDRKPALRLHYLDGIRGLAALYVVFHHAYLQVTGPEESKVLAEQIPALALMSVRWLEFGSFSVAIFIILSGYCLMLPVVSRGILSGGWIEYIKRRAKRILPPYYAAIGLSLLLVLIFPFLNQPSGTIWDVTEDTFSLQSILPHLFLVHNWRGVWAFKINYPMWTVSTEWQIYFLLPLILLPLWRKFGLWVMTIAAVVVGFAPHYLLNGFLDRAKPWYFSLFALGAAAAVISTSTEPQYIKLRQQIPWGVAATFFAVLVSVIVIPQERNWLDTHEVVSDPLVAGVTFCALVQCTQTAMNGKMIESNSPKTWLLKLLSHPWALGLGAFSYSLYLVHAPILALIDLPLKAAHVSSTLRLAIGLGISVPISVGVSYLFYWIFERPLMRRSNKANVNAL